MLAISCNLLNTVLKVKNRMAAWVENGCKCIGCLSSGSPDWPGAAALCPAWQHKRVSEKIKIQNSKYNFYWLHSIFVPL